MDALVQFFAEIPMAVVALFSGLAGWLIADLQASRRVSKLRAKYAEQIAKARLDAARARTDAFVRRQRDPVTFEPTCLDDPPEWRQN